MESAIPPHLTVARTHQRRIPDDFAPPYPSFVARPAPGVRRVAMAYLGAEDGDVTGVEAALAEPDGPRHHDRAVQDGGAVVVAAYWDDPAAHERWTDRHREPWLAAPGRWVEAIRPRVETTETIFGSRSRPEGLAMLADGFSGEVQEHAYWGGMRDRMPASQTDRLHDPGPVDVERVGDRVRVRPRGSVCLIRSGQDWSDTSPEERRLYLDDVEPDLRAGMDFLRESGLDVGCLANRYLTVLDDQGRPTERTYGLGWWRTMADLEQWSGTHPTHLAIFGAFNRLVRRQGGITRLRLYHEVSVAGPDDQWFEYSGCPDGTGLTAGSGSR